jgi:putative transposase
MVAKAGGYPWSSARFHLGLLAADALVKDRTLRELVEDWAECLVGSDEATQKQLLKKSVRSGRPAGGDQFVKLIESLTRRDLRLRKAGRPLKVAS